MLSSLPITDIDVSTLHLENNNNKTTYNAFPIKTVHLVESIPSSTTSSPSSPTEVLLSKFSNKIVIQISQCKGKVGSIHLVPQPDDLYAGFQTLIGRRDPLEVIYVGEIAKIVSRVRPSVPVLVLLALRSGADVSKSVGPHHVTNSMSELSLRDSVSVEDSDASNAGHDSRENAYNESNNTENSKRAEDQDFEEEDPSLSGERQRFLAVVELVKNAVGQLL